MFAYSVLAAKCVLASVVLSIVIGNMADREEVCGEALHK